MTSGPCHGTISTRRCSGASNSTVWQAPVAMILYALDLARVAGFLPRRPPLSTQGGLVGAGTTSSNSRYSSHILSPSRSLINRRLPTTTGTALTAAASSLRSPSSLLLAVPACQSKPSLQNYSDAFRAPPSLAPKSGCSVPTPVGAFTSPIRRLSARRRSDCKAIWWLDPSPDLPDPRP